MSGHSKFANIKHKKEKNDAAKGKIFTKLGREIAVAVKEGTIESAKWEVEGDAVTIKKDNELKTVLTAVKAGEAKVSVTVTVKIGDKTETATKTVTIQVNNPAKKE